MQKQLLGIKGKKLDNSNFMSPAFRVAGASVFTREKDDYGKDNYRITLLFSKEQDLSLIREMIDSAIEEKWPNKKPKEIMNPLKDGDQPDAKGNIRWPGYYRIFTDSADKPQIKSLKKEGNGFANITSDEESPDGFYNGCYARGLFRTYAYDKAGKQGVKICLVSLQKITDGEPIRPGQRNADADFDNGDLTPEMFNDPNAGDGFEEVFTSNE